MNDDLKESLQILIDLKKELDATVPVIAKTAKQIMMSPEMQTMVEIRNKARVVLPEVIKRFDIISAFYSELSRNFTNNVTPILLGIARISLSLKVIERLGNIQYVAWENFPEVFYNQVADVNSEHELLEFVVMWLEDNGFADIENTIQYLSETDQLKDNLVFLQAVEAYRREEYDLACLGFTAMLDRLLSELSGMITSTSISKRAGELKDKVSKDGVAGLDEFELNDYILMITYSGAIKKFGDSSDFDKDEPDLNRHWIAHGRMTRSMDKIDCIRIINMLCGTVLMAKLGSK